LGWFYFIGLAIVDAQTGNLTEDPSSLYRQPLGGRNGRPQSAIYKRRCPPGKTC